MSPSSPKEAEEVEEMEEEEEVEEVEEEIEYEEVTDEEEKEQSPKPKPSVPESIASLQSLNGTLSDFLHHYNSLQQTLDSINSSLNGSSGSKPIKFEVVAANDRQFSELESICRISCAKALRKYVITNLGEIDRLHREVPEALKLAPNPEKLVLDAMGRFYLQGRRAYKRGDPNAIDSRRAGILLLEFYVFAGCPVAAVENPASASLKEIAREAAVSWMNRLVSEGGLETAKAVDALGLVLLVASFGIPSQFRTKDLYRLLQLSNLMKKGVVLRCSPILVHEMPDIIKDLIAKDMHVEAVDLVCTFGLEEKFPPLQLLSLFVKKTCEVGVDERREVQCSLRSLKEANGKQLVALKSVVKCLEDHKLDATELASLKIDQKIAKCENEISRAELKLHNKNVKRKFEDVDPLKIQDSQAKQFWSSAEASHFPIPQSIRQPQEQGIAAISDSRYAYNGYTANNMPVSAEASHGLVGRNNLDLLAQNVHGPTGRWQGNTGYQSSVGRSLLGAPYSSGYDYTRYSAAAGENVYQTPASGQNIYRPLAAELNIYQQLEPGQNIYQPPESGQNIYQPPVAGQNIYQPPESGQNIYRPLSAELNIYQQPEPGQNIYQSPESGQNIYQPPVAGQNIYHSPASGQNIYQQPAPGPNMYQQPGSVQQLYQPPASSLVTGGRNIFQSADTVSEGELPNYSAASNPVPTATSVSNPTHQSSYAD